MKNLIFLLLFVLCINLFSQTANKTILKEIIINELDNHKKYESKIQLLTKFDENYTHLITLDDVMISFSKETQSDGIQIFSNTKYDYDTFRKSFVEYLQNPCFHRLLNDKTNVRLYINISTEDDLFYDVKFYY